MNPPAPRQNSIIEHEAEVTDVVLAAMAQAPSDRLREVAAAFVRHIHAFAREVKLTEAEYDIGIDFLNRIGQATNDRHNEGILFADAVGFSTLVCLLNNGNAGATETAAALLGPFWRLNSPRTANGGSIVRSPTPGPQLFASCTILDTSGKPIEGVEVDVWHSSPVGLYENQDDSQADMNLRGKFTTDAEGRFWFSTVKMVGYPIPTGGLVGRLLKAQNRQPNRPAHLHALIVKPGFKVLISQVYDPSDPNLEDDPQFGVTRALVGAFVRHDEPHPTDPSIRGPWHSFGHTYVMQPGEAILPVPPIK